MPWKNASVEKQRRLLVAALLKQNESVAGVCQRFHVHRPTAHKFLQRFRAEGLGGLKDRSRAPHTRSPQALVWQRRVLVLRRGRPTWGARKLRWLLQQRFAEQGPVPGERTIQRWVARAGLTRPRRRGHRRGIAKDHSQPALAHSANAVWTMDLKGWFRTDDGSKIEPLTVCDLWSRYILYNQHLAPRNEQRIRRICERLFRRHGRPQVIRCDRGAPFYGDGPCGFTRLSLWWWRLGIRVEFVRRGHIHNNAHEQMHGVLKKEVAQPASLTRKAQAGRLARWRSRYNQARPHEALGLQPPASLYRSAPSALPPLTSPHYPAHWLVRRVQKNGEVQLPGWRGSIGRAFASQHVGFRLIAPQRYHVTFAALFLGELDLHLHRKLRLAPY